MKHIQFIKTEKNITIYIEGTPLMCDKSHSNYFRILKMLKNQENNEIDINELKSLFSLGETIRRSHKNLEIKEGQVYYKGNIVDNVITKKIVAMIKENLNVDYMLKFLDNLLQNPSKSSIEELYLFMEVGNLPISKDGYLYAYKKIRSNFRDIYTNKMDNSVGEVVKMPRKLVNDNRNETCSTGLHFCSYDYLNFFGSSNSNKFKIVVVKINPKDIVSIPIDYNNTKGRCCEYKVVKDITEEYLRRKIKILEENLIYDENEENFDDNDY